MGAVLALRPETRVIAVATQGMMGSPVSIVRNNGELTASTDISAYATDALYNWRHIHRTTKERRKVSIEISDVTDAIKAQPGVRAQNAVLEHLFNRVDPRTGTINPSWYVPRRYDDPRPAGPYELPPLKAPQLSGQVSPAELSAATDVACSHLAKSRRRLTR